MTVYVERIVQQRRDLRGEVLTVLQRCHTELNTTKSSPSERPTMSVGRRSARSRSRCTQARFGRQVSESCEASWLNASSVACRSVMSSMVPVAGCEVDLETSQSCRRLCVGETAVVGLDLSQETHALGDVASDRGRADDPARALTNRRDGDRDMDVRTICSSSEQHQTANHDAAKHMIPMS